MRAGKGIKTKRSPVSVFLPVTPRIRSALVPIIPYWHHLLFLQHPFLSPCSLSQPWDSLWRRHGKSVSIHFTIAFIQTERGATNLILSVYGTLAWDRKRSPVKNLPEYLCTFVRNSNEQIHVLPSPQFKYKKFRTFSFMV